MLPYRALVFDVLQLSACVYALKRGGMPERWVAAMMAVAATASAMVPIHAHSSYNSVEWIRLGIDAALFLALLALAVRANRYWPLWMASLQLIALGVHGVRGYDLTLLPRVYARVLGEISYPMILLLVIGTYRHQIRLQRRGADESWSKLVW